MITAAGGASVVTLCWGHRLAHGDAAIIGLELAALLQRGAKSRPPAVDADLGRKRSQDWLLGHALQLMVAIAVLLGAYLTVSGLIRLS